MAKKRRAFASGACAQMTARSATVAVVILTLNQRSKALSCLESLFESEPAPFFRVVLWDNGSTDGTIEAVREAFPEALAHHHPSNLGVASGRNAAAKLAIDTLAPTHLLFLDNDMLLEPGFVSALLRPFADDARLGQTQAKLRFMHDRERLNDAGGARIEFWRARTIPVGFGEMDRGQYDTAAKCLACGGAMMVRTDVFQQLGGFDAQFDPFGPEDLDFTLRLAKAGYYALYVPDAVAYHEVSHTIGKGYTEEYARNKLRFFLLLLRRHAPLAQQISFFIIGVPYLAVGVALREGRRGNFGALRGLARGATDFLKSP